MAEGRRVRQWKQDPEGVRAGILAAARREFAAHGLSGARIQRIVDQTQTSKRMIFYYFGDKEGLWRAVLEEAYRGVRAREEALDLDGLAPEDALARLVAFTFDHHRADPDFIRLVAIENIHGARHLARIPGLAETNRAAIAVLERIHAAGVAAGTFRAEVSPLDLHWHISALCFFNVANRATFAANFGEQPFAPDAQERLKAQAVRGVLEIVRRDGPAR
jgi:AcrR family transcriptional regulator